MGNYTWNNYETKEEFLEAVRFQLSLREGVIDSKYSSNDIDYAKLTDDIIDDIVNDVANYITDKDDDTEYTIYHHQENDFHQTITLDFNGFEVTTTDYSYGTMLINYIFTNEEIEENIKYYKDEFNDSDLEEIADRLDLTMDELKDFFAEEGVK